MPATPERLPGRQHQRVSFGAEIAVQIPDWSALRARAVDMSYGGMSLILAERLTPGDRLVFGLRTADGAPMRVEGVVRNVVRLAANRFRVGLEWASLIDEEKSELRLFVDSLAAEAA